MQSPLFILTRRIIYSSLYTVDMLLGRKTAISILCYHAIARDNWRFSIDPDEFRKQILHLKKKVNFISFQDLLLFFQEKKNLPHPAVLLTFDDGYASIWKVRNFLKDNGIYPIVFLLSSPEQADRNQLESNADFLTQEQINGLKELGWVFGCHSATHTDFSKLDKDKTTEEVILAKILLEEQLGEKVISFAYPKGRYTTNILQAVKKAGYRCAMSMDPGFITKDSDLFQLPRIGVDRTHTIYEFMTLASPSVISARQIVLSTPLRRFL